MQENLYTAEGRPSNSHFAVIKFPFLDLACFVVARKMHNGFNSILKFSTVMTSTGPAFQECTGSCHVNVPDPKLDSHGFGMILA